ncbi:helix-turn-helix transcriptional regulator [Streptomyces sp. 1222.5]|uniref:helix-turn-helix transcriptional regulator n=1 Tax=Streptomyces sp. 1222.5 TaxID=1881026 RepID=UPI003D753702
MDELNVPAAARRLGITEWAVRRMISAGRLPNQARTGPALVASADVHRVMQERRAEALRRHPDAEAFARQVRAQLWPNEVLTRQVVLADGRMEQVPVGFLPTAGQVGPASGREALHTLTPDAAAVFGRAAVEVAALDPKTFTGACRFCFADMSAQVHGGLRPTDAPAYRVLLGEPCAADVQRWRAEGEAQRQEMSRLRAAEERDRRRADRARAQAEFEAARRDAETAASRLQKATRAYAAMNPSVARQAASQARQRVAFANRPTTSRIPAWCTCDASRQCARHADMDRQAALKRGRR